MTKSQNAFTEMFTVIPDSKSKIKSSSYLESGKYAVVDQGKELVAGYTDTSPTVEENSLPVIVFGDHTRAVKYIDFPFTAGADGTQILKPSSLTNPKYGFYSVLYAVGKIPSKGYARHFGELKKMRFLLPSLEKQRGIVEKLDSAFAEIDLLEGNLGLRDEKANQLLQSLLSESFSSNRIAESPITELAISEICEVGDGNHSSKYPTKNEMISAGVPFIRAQNIINGTVNDSDILYISDEKHESLKKGHLRTGDILITNRGEIGKLAIVPAEFNGSNLNSQIAWLRCNERVNNSYLYYFLKSENARKYFDLGTSGSALQQLTISKLKQIRVPAVSLLDQKKIVEKLDEAFAEIELLKLHNKQKKAQAVSLRQSFLSSAFTWEDAVA
jgi:type I restriction enzyme S subunit